MALNIISNFAANSALTNLTFSSMEATKSVSKLSSGTRVVTAADDAAALAIGSRLRVEVSALSVAAVNTSQASSLLQIADGSLARTQDVLNRMKQLAVQAGSENLGNIERGLLDVEFQNLIAEIDRLSDESEFNGKKLFAYQNINEDKYTQPTGAFARIGTTFNLAAGGTSPLALGRSAGGQVINMSITNFNNVVTSSGGDGSFNFTISMNNDSDGSAGIGGTQPTGARDYAFTLTGASEAGSLQFTTNLDNDLLDQSGNSSGVRLHTGVTLRFELDSVNTSTSVSAFTRENAGFVLSLDDDFDMQSVTQGTGSAALTDSFSLQSVNPTLNPRDENEQAPTTDFTFKVGTGINPFEDNIAVSWGGVSRENLGVDNHDITTAARADAASLAVSFAIDYVVDIRADVGASMNRLETAARNVATMKENMEAARSVLLDLDVAAEITTFTSKQILVQAGISVLAQANQLPQNLLRLFA